MNLIRTAKELLDIKENYRFHVDYKKLKELGISRFSDEDFDLYMFEQVWGNTSGGFEGMGGSMMTTQTTYVIVPKVLYDECLVFFGGGFAYKVPYSKEFMEDVVNKRVEGKSRYGRYLKDI